PPCKTRTSPWRAIGALSGGRDRPHPPGVGRPWRRWGWLELRTRRRPPERGGRAPAHADAHAHPDAPLGAQGLAGLRAPGPDPGLGAVRAGAPAAAGSELWRPGRWLARLQPALAGAPGPGPHAAGAPDAGSRTRQRR